MDTQPMASAITISHNDDSALDYSKNETNEMEKCTICNDISHGIHFGAIVCRACAAFFRRSTISNRKYVCRFDGKCKIGRDKRCSCRACRLQKCINVGMDPSGVQRNRDQIGPRKCKSILSQSESEQQDDRPNAETYGNELIKDSLNFSPMLSTTSNDRWITTKNQAISNYPTILDKNDPTKSYTLLAKCSPSTSNSILNGQCQRINGSTPINISTSQPSNSNNSTIYGRNIQQIFSTFNTNSNFLNFVSSSTICDENQLISDALRNSSTSSSQISTLMEQSSTIFNHLARSENVCVNTPLINEMQSGYKKYLALRRTAGSLNQNQTIYGLLSNDTSFKLGTYFDDILAVKGDLSLISELISNHFPPLANFSTKSKWILLRNFFCPVMLIERSYHTSKHFPNIDDSRVIISPYHYMDISSLVHFFSVEQCKVEPSKMATVFEPTFQKAVLRLINPFREMQIFENEIVGLIGLLFWNNRGIDGLTTNESKLIEQTQNSLFSELYFICRQNVGSTADYGLRFSRLCAMISHSYKIADELASNFSLVNVTNSFDVDAFLHSFVTQAW